MICGVSALASEGTARCPCLSPWAGSREDAVPPVPHPLSSHAHLSAGGGWGRSPGTSHHVQPFRGGDRKQILFLPEPPRPRPY